MTEKDMEDLIAAYPDDFFFQKGFVLVGRQRSLAGVGRFDLLFEDRFESTILMELKARTLKYEDATQVAKYRDELKRNDCKHVVMWLVAPHIPNSIREFLDDKGIEYTEIHAAEFRRVAERHDLVIKSERVYSKAKLRSAVVQQVSRTTDRREELGRTGFGIREAVDRLGSEWTARGLMEILQISRTSTQRRLKMIEDGQIEMISGGKKGRGGMAKYRFVETVPNK